MKKSLLVFGLLLMVVGIFFGCSQKSSASEEVPTIRWVQIGFGMPDNYDAWSEHINSYIVDKIGARVEVEVIPWGDFKTRRSVMVNTGESYDIMFTPEEFFVNDVMMGAFSDITEKVKTITPDLYNMIPENYWKAVSIDGKIYGVPTYKDSSITNYYIWVKDYVDKYNIDVENLLTLEQMTPIFEKIRAEEGINPYPLASLAPSPAREIYDSLGSGLMAMGVAFDDETRTAVAIYEQEDILSELEVLHDWYKKGIINADAPTLAQAPAYRVMRIGQGWSTAATTVWGPQIGAEVIPIQRSRTILSNDTVRGSVNCINTNSSNIDKVLEFLQLINTDSYVRDAFYYGLEGDNFDYTADGRVHKNHDGWSMVGYPQATFFNVSLLDTETVDQWAEVKELNDNAYPSVVLGFTMNTEPVEDEIANCYTIFMKYRLQLLTGAGEPRSTVAAMMKEMRAAGFDKILNEAQAQLDSTF